MKLLIVEDERELSDNIVSYLSSENYVCEQAFSYEEAGMKTGLYDYDCVVLDLMLPGGNGLDLLRELRRRRNPVGVIIVYVRWKSPRRTFAVQPFLPSLRAGQGQRTGACHREGDLPVSRVEGLLQLHRQTLLYGRFLVRASTRLLIFRGRGINELPDEVLIDRTDAPSFFGLYMGLNIPLSSYDIDEEHEFRTSSGSSAGLEGAWFFNPYVGIGGRFTVSSTSIIVNGSLAEDNTFDVLSLFGGSYFSYPLSRRWLIGSKLLTGLVHYPRLELTDQTVPARCGIGFGTGASLTFRASHHYGVKLFMDYNLLPSHSKSSGEYMNQLVGGASFQITF